jgi:hypothetical protein
MHRPLVFREVEAPRISRQSAYESDKVVSPTHPLPPPPPQETPLVFISITGRANPMARVWPEGLSQRPQMEAT